MKCASLVSWSTTTKMESFPLTKDRYLMKSSEIDPQDWLGIDKGWKRPNIQCLGAFDGAQI